MAEILWGVKAGTTLEKMSAGRAMLIAIWDAPREAVAENPPYFVKR